MAAGVSKKTMKNYTEFNPKDFSSHDNRFDLNDLLLAIKKHISLSKKFDEFNPLNFRIGRVVDNAELHFIEWE
jgi:hypothetical protein